MASVRTLVLGVLFLLFERAGHCCSSSARFPRLGNVVYNMEGQQIDKRLVHDNQIWDARAVTEGVYVIKALQGSKHALTQKVIVK